MNRQLTPISIPPLPMASLSTKYFRWNHTEAWNDEYKEYVAQILSDISGQIFTHRFFKSSKKHRRPTAIGSWILTFPDHTKPEAYVEAVVDPRKFNDLELRIFTAQEAPHDHLRPALEFFISALMIAAKADILHIYASNQKLLAHFSGDAFLSKTIWTPNGGEFFAEFRHAPFAKTEMVEVDPSEWWKSARGAELKDQLRYLELRLKPKTNWNTRKRPRSLVSRLFGRR